MNKLKIHSAYLPYGLKFSSSMDKPFEDYGLQSIWTLDGINKLFGDYCLLTKENNDAYAINSCKPILFSLEDLTKEITIGGETFVPFDELIKIKNVRLRVEKYENGDKKLLNINTFSFSLFDFEYKIIEKLLEWKFNVFNLPEIEYIKVTEENNPYK